MPNVGVPLSHQYAEKFARRDIYAWDSAFTSCQSDYHCAMRQSLSQIGPLRMLSTNSQSGI